ncbi:flagellar hook assembly protein FlgD [Simplicispira psychrophila]|uniref:flagellar hook assembly protein FlgD n=1 Tax=Simplicispira psychrophila TaxID=80882 RepID=UPI00068B5B33|nr:flagellar hook capping FlgD N-terminal domain-containing protein [Simplicispira psychrophila]
MTSAITSSTPSANVASTSASTNNINANDAANSQDRFLKLLVAQLNNQDPMNPLDNAQMTSQIAQINTVTGIEQLNTTVKGLVSQFSAQQLLQGTAMVGRQVLVEGDSMAINAETKTAYGALDLSEPAADVQVQVLNASGKELGVVDLGSLKAGRVNFEWDASAHPDSGPLHFQVQAKNGATNVTATPLTIDQVVSVSQDNGTLQLQLGRGNTIDYGAIKSVL